MTRTNDGGVYRNRLQRAGAADRSSPIRRSGRIGDVERELLEQAIGETIFRLFIATDRRDWEAVRACLTDEVLFDMSSLSGENPANVTAAAIVDDFSLVWIGRRLGSARSSST
jgi:hypothetical protein